MTALRALTWNIQYGLGMDGRVDLKRIVEYAMDIADPDILCFQEVSANMPSLERTDGCDQFAALADLLPRHQAIVGAALEIFDPTGAPRRFGNVVFSRYPVAQVLRHTLPWIPGGERNMPRGMIEATVMSPFGAVRIMTTHLEYFSADSRSVQVDAIRQIHAAACARSTFPVNDGSGPYEPTPRPGATLLLGDFNMRPDDPLKARLSQATGPHVSRLLDAWSLRYGDDPHPPSFCITDQTYGLPHCCDFVFASEELAARIHDITYDGDVRFSDHQPVSISLR